MFCTNCGNQLPDNVKFCTRCGAKTELQEAAPAEPAVQTIPGKSSKLPVIIAIIITVILFGVGIFAVTRLIAHLDPGSSVTSHVQTDSDNYAPENEQTVVAEMPEETATDDDTATEEVPETIQTEPPVRTTADLVSHDSIAPLMEQALAMRAEADAKWDHKKEIPGECEYKGYIYMDNPDNCDDNRLYLVFVMNATVKDVPIQFVYWVFYNDIAFDDTGNISYKSMGTSRDDGYTVKTAFGSYYSYYGLDSYDLFLEKIISTNGFVLTKESVFDVEIQHPVSDTYN